MCVSAGTHGLGAPEPLAAPVCPTESLLNTLLSTLTCTIALCNIQARCMCLAAHLAACRQGCHLFGDRRHIIWDDGHLVQQQTWRGAMIKQMAEHTAILVAIPYQDHTAEHADRHLESNRYA